MEDRTLLSTLLWSNRGSALSDTDGFNAVFGARAATARAVVDAALHAWQNIILNFNYADGGNTFTFTISADPARIGNGAETWFGLQLDAMGRPRAARIQIGAGSDGHGAGFFLDADPYNSPAFRGTLLNPYAREATAGSSASGLGDLFSVVSHEITHGIGINTDPGEMFQRNRFGYLRNTAMADGVDRPGTLFTFTGPSVTALFTSDDGETTDTGRALHSARLGNSYTDSATGRRYSGTADLMNATYLYGRRMLPSEMIALVLKDVYGYTITNAPGFATGSSTNPPASILATGADSGGPPVVQVYDAATRVLEFQFYAYDPAFLGGVKVAVSNINGTPTIITAPGPGIPGAVRIFDGSSGAMLREFLAYNPRYAAGVNVAIGDVNGDGFPDIVTAAAAGNPHVKVYDGKAIANGSFDNLHPDNYLLAQFFAYGLQFNIGANVAVGDVINDGFADIVTGASAGNPHVKVYSGRAIAMGSFSSSNPDASLLTQFFAYGLQFNVGVNVAVGDIEGNGYADIVTAATVGNPHVKVYSGRSIAASVNPPSPDAFLLAQFFAYGLQYNIGANVAVADVNGDGYADIITGACRGSPHVKIYSGRSIATHTFNNANPDAALLAQFFCCDPLNGAGVNVSAARVR